MHHQRSRQQPIHSSHLTLASEEGSFFSNHSFTASSNASVWLTSVTVQATLNLVRSESDRKTNKLYGFVFGGGHNNLTNNAA
ncbi:hypothetical protein [Microseira wollei]|uniref:hypothetical protein n=1 Tax=Microseira wollei TaxID=467598 RepID=UPI0021F51495|nr:hypothetical protein [Microseira wollei]